MTSVHPNWNNAALWARMWHEVAQLERRYAGIKAKREGKKAIRVTGSRYAGWQVIDRQGSQLARYGPELGTTRALILARYRKERTS